MGRHEGAWVHAGATDLHRVRAVAVLARKFMVFAVGKCLVMNILQQLFPDVMAPLGKANSHSLASPLREKGNKWMYTRILSRRASKLVLLNHSK